MPQLARMTQRRVGRLRMMSIPWRGWIPRSRSHAVQRHWRCSRIGQRSHRHR